MFQLLVDSHSKWGKVIDMAKTATVMSTMAGFQHLLAVYGLPEQIVSDNGPQFTSEEFTKFLQANGVKHSQCSPYNPSSNVAVGYFVCTFKQVMRVRKHERLSLGQQL